MMTTQSGAVHDDDVVAVPLRHPWRWVTAVALLVLVGAFLSSLWKNPNVIHGIISEFLFDPRILHGVWLTIFLTVASMVIGTILATALAIMRLSTNPVLRVISWVYIWFFRGTPLLVQIVFWGFLGLLYAEITVGIPMTDITFWQQGTSTLVPPLAAGLLALSLNEGAYASEIVRAGLLSIDSGQREAAYSLGMSPGYTMRRIVLPQAMKVIIPPMGNETISMLKNTSLLGVVAVGELYTQAAQISSQNLAQVELLVVASIWYLIMTTVLSVPQYYLERYYARGSSRNLPPTPLQQLRATYERILGRRKDRALVAAHAQEES